MIPVATPGAPVTEGYHAPEHSLTFAGLVRSEWIKFWSVRSISISMIVAAACIVGLGLLLGTVSAVMAEGTNEGAPAVDGLSVETNLLGAQIATLIAAVVGVLFITGEFSTGMIRTSFTVVPRRAPVLWAKAVVLAVAVAGLLGTSAFAAFFLGQAIGGDSGIGDPGVLRILLGNALVMAGTALAGLGVGAVLRSAAAAISALLGLLLVLPLLLLPVPDFPGKVLITRYNFGNTTPSLTMLGEQAGAPSVGASVVGFCVWVALLVLLGGFALRRRDV